MLSLMLCFWGKTTRTTMICFLIFFVSYMFENEIIKLPTWTKCAIFWSFYNMYNAQCFFLLFFCFCFVFLDQHYNPTYLTSPPHHTSHGICAFFCCKIILKKEKKKEKKFASSSTAVSFSCPGCSRWSSQQVYYCNLNKDNRRMK